MPQVRGKGFETRAESSSAPRRGAVTPVVTATAAALVPRCPSPGWSRHPANGPRRQTLRPAEAVERDLIRAAGAGIHGQGVGVVWGEGTALNASWRDGLFVIPGSARVASRLPQTAGGVPLSGPHGDTLPHVQVPTVRHSGAS